MKLIRKIVSAVAAVVCFAAMAVTSFADYTYSLDDKQLVSEIQADSYVINGTEGTYEKNNLKAAETDDAISMRLAVFNDYLSKTWWDSDDVTVSVDVKLETEGVDVMGFIAGFDRSWKWINPSNYVPLEYGKWVTVSETGKHFQEIWGERGPNQFMFQVRANWDAGDQGYVKVSVRNFRIEGRGNEEEPEVTSRATTTSATTEQTTTTVDTEPAETTVSEPVDVHTSEPEDAATAESTVTESTPAETTAAAEVSEPEKPAETTTSAVVTAATEAAAPDMSQIVLERPDTGKDIASVIIIVVVAVVVVIAAVVIGYVIYKKKKFY